MTKKEFIKKYVRTKKCVNHKLCSTCEEVCCKVSGCEPIPFDIEPFTKEHIIDLIDKGIYSIVDAHSPRGGVFPILRTREVGAGIFNFSNAPKPCALLGEKGCKLSVDERPTMALLLIPRRHPVFPKWRNCKQLLDTRRFLKLWYPKIDIMEDVVKHYSPYKNFDTLYSEWLNSSH